MAARLMNLGIVLLWTLFAIANAHPILVEGNLKSAPLFATYTVFAGLFVFRRRPIETSGRPVDWVVAQATWLPLLVRPTDSEGMLVVVGSVVAAVATAAMLVSALALGRSFGIVAANRGVKRGGPYQFVRHPVYASDMVLLAATLLASFSIWNAVVLTTTCAGLVARIRSEERFLMSTPEYPDYAAQVRWRLLPYVF